MCSPTPDPLPSNHHPTHTDTTTTPPHPHPPLAVIARLAVARVVVHEVGALPVLSAGRLEAVVDVVLAEGAIVAGLAGAARHAGRHCAARAVQARVALDADGDLLAPSTRAWHNV